MGHSLDNKELLIKLYIKERNTLVKLSKKYKIGRQTLSALLKKHNIKVRTHREAITDEYTPFRFYMSGLRKSNYGKRPNLARLQPTVKQKTLTLSHLKEVWEKQKGTCPYTHIKLKLFTLSKAKYQKGGLKGDLRNASLDRIDSSKPYEIGNVQFVVWPINYAKNTLSDKQMKKFMKLIRQTRKTNR